MANYTAAVLAALLVMVMAQLYKIHSLNCELRKQMESFEAMKKSLSDHITFCERRNGNCNLDLEKELAVNSGIRSKLKRLEPDNEKLVKEVYKLNDELKKYEEEEQQMQQKADEMVQKLEEAASKIQSITKGKDKAEKDAEKYRLLYVEGNKLLSAIRAECQKIKESAVPQGNHMPTPTMGKRDTEALKQASNSNAGAPQQDASTQSTSRKPTIAGQNE